MRTTLTLEPLTAERINRLMAIRGLSMKSVVNEALRAGLKVIERSAPPPGRFVVEAHDFSVRTGIDLDTIGRIADGLEDEGRVRSSRLAKSRKLRASK